MNEKTRLISIKEVSKICGLSRPEIYRRAAENSFPKSVRLSSKCVRWSENEIYEWNRIQLEKRNS